MSPSSAAAQPQQLNKLRAFRQDIYAQAFTARRDAQFELLDALLSGGPTRSFAELSQNPVFRRNWCSAYSALEDGRQDEAWLRQYLVQQLPKQGLVLLAADATCWPRPRAPTLPDRQFVHSPTQAVLAESVVIGQPYAIVAWVAQAASSWALPLDLRRIPSSKTAQQLAAEQIDQLDQLRQPDDQALWIYALDGAYGNLGFWQLLKADQRRAVVTRLRHDRVLFQPAPPYAGRGRPRKHGARFACKDPASWGSPQQQECLVDEQWGQVELRYWDQLHDRGDAGLEFAVLRAVVHNERAKPAAPLWLSWHGPSQPPSVIWRAYVARWAVEPSIRVRKESLHWTQPRLGSLGAMGCWSIIVSIAMWVLYLARGLVADHGLPWQRAQEQKTPERVLAGMGELFGELGTPARAPQRRGKAPGWPTGRLRKRRERLRVVKKQRTRRRGPPQAG